MKFKVRHIVAIALIVWVVGQLSAPTKLFDLSGRVGSLSISKLTKLVPSIDSAYAQAVGYQGANNVHIAFVNADFTDGSGVTTLQNIPRLQFALPASQGVAFKIDCDLFYSQATNVADSFGIQFSNSPTNAEFGGWMFTNATAIAAGPAANITNATATAVLTGTPAVSTVLDAHMGGITEQASNTTDTTVNISVSQTTAANVIVVRRGSACVYHSMN